MPHPLYQCPWCSTKCIDRTILSHIRSDHPKEFYEKYKYSIRASMSTSKLIHIDLSCDGVKGTRQCCLGCSKLYKKPALAEQHLATCTKKKEHKEACRTLDTSPHESSESIEQLQNEILKLKRKLELAEEEAKDNASKAETFDLVMACIHEHLEEEEREEWRKWLELKKESVDWENYL